MTNNVTQQQVKILRALNKVGEAFNDALDAVLIGIPREPSSQLPVAERHTITYRKLNGVVGKYEISNPVEEFDDKLTAYCFTRKGMRTFIKDSILSVE